MAIKDTDKIKVINQSQGKIIVTSSDNNYTFEPSLEKEYGYMELPFSEVKSIHKNSKVFRYGILSFEKDMEKEIYDALNIYDTKDIWTDERIRNFFMNPTSDECVEISKIKIAHQLQRIRSMMIGMLSTNLYEISSRLVNFIHARYDELQDGIINTKIADIPMTYNKETSELSKDDLIQELKKMQQQILELQAKDKQEEKINLPSELPKNDTSAIDVTESVEVSDKIAKSNRGRKPAAQAK